MTSLRDICLLITDGKHGDCQNEPDSKYYFVSCKDVKDGWIDYSNARQITENDYRDTHKRTQLEFQDIVITNSGTIGRMALVADSDETRRTTFQKSVAVVKPDKEKVMPRWLYYGLISNRDALIAWSGGTAQKNLLLRDLRAFEMDVPPFEIQRKIAAILSAYDDLIENNQRRIKILEEMAQTIYREWFVNFRFPGHENVKMVDSELGLIPEGWEVANLFDISEVTYGFPFKSKQFTDEQTETPVIRIRDLKNNRTATFTTEEPYTKHRVVNGDLLVGMDGNFHMCKWAGDVAYLNQRVVRFRPGEGLSPYYLFLSLEKPINYFDSTVVGTTVAHLSDRHLRSVNLLKPDDRMLNLTNDTFNPIFELEMNLHAKNSYLRQTRNLLLPRLISGELDVSDLDIDINEEAP